MKTKGIILAGGAGSRMFPVSTIYSKQLIMVYDKPMIYYPLSTLMLGGIKDILIITNSITIPFLKKLLKDGTHLGIKISYEIQDKPEGIAQSLIIGSEFIDNEQIVLILGDNIFYGSYDFLRNAIKNNKGATIFGYYVSNPERYGVIQFENNKTISIIEKPKVSKSHYAVPGLYIYDETCSRVASELKPSDRGEFEITDVNNVYLKQNRLNVIKLGRGFAWLDTGTPSSLMDASNFIETMEKRQSLKIGCIEEIAYNMKYIDKNSLKSLIKSYPTCSYKNYIEKLLM